MLGARGLMRKSGMERLERSSCTHSECVTGKTGGKDTIRGGAFEDGLSIEMDKRNLWSRLR